LTFHPESPCRLRANRMQLCVYSVHSTDFYTVIFPGSNLWT
jgi:hypothetical protein